MQHAQKRRSAKPPLAEPEPDVDQHTYTGDQYRQERIVSKFLADGRSEQFFCYDIVICRSEVFVDRADDLGALIAVKGLDGTDHDFFIAFSGVNDFRIQLIFLNGLFYICCLDRLAHIHLDHGASGEVDPVIHASGYAEHESQCQDHNRNQIEYLSIANKMKFSFYVEGCLAGFVDAEHAALSKLRTVCHDAHIKLSNHDSREYSYDDTDHERPCEALD